MQFKKLALTFTLSAAFGLMACGDDSSSGSDLSAKEELEALEKEFKELQKEAKDQYEKLGECTEDKKGDEETVTLQGEKYTVTCDQDEFGDWDWLSEDLDKLGEEWEAKLKEAREKAKQEENDEPTPKPTPDPTPKGPQCDFTAGDDVWEVIIPAGKSIQVITFEFDGDTYTETRTTKVDMGTPDACEAEKAKLAGTECDGQYYMTFVDMGEKTLESTKKDLYEDVQMKYCK